MTPTPRIYLDHNATSLMRPCVKEAISNFLQHSYGNASSIHALGRKARDILDDARDQVASYLGVPGRELIFTSGGTEANHLAWNAFKQHSKKQYILSSVTEHPCIMGAQDLAKTAEHHVQALSFLRRGKKIDTWQDSLKQQSWDFCSVHVANNETGIITPIAQLVNALIAEQEQKPLLHLDAVQAVGKLDVTEYIGFADYMTVSGHKLGALQGAGVLFKRDGLPLRSLWLGSSQEKGRRGGTENLLGQMAMGAACKYLKEHQQEEQHLQAQLRSMLEEGFLKYIPDIEIVGQNESRLHNTSCIVFADIDAQSLLVAADLEGIDISTGAACTSGSIEPSHVLLNMGYSTQEASSSLRFSLGWSNTEQEVAHVLKIFPKLVERARNVRK